MLYLHEHYPNLDLHQIEHAPNPIFSSARRNPRRRLKIVSVGSFSHAKGADIVLKALDQLVAESDFEFLWIGAPDQNLEQRLRSETSGALWSRVSFKNELSPEEIAAELSTATLFVHGTRADNSPNSVKEAVVAGVPVVATNTGGIPDYVFDAKNGFLFCRGDIQECREKIRLALAHPLFSRGEVDAPTLRELRERLSAEKMAKKFYEAYLATVRIYNRTRSGAEFREQHRSRTVVSR